MPTKHSKKYKTPLVTEFLFAFFKVATLPFVAKLEKETAQRNAILREQFRQHCALQ